MMLLVAASFAIRDLAPHVARRAATARAAIAATGSMSFLIANGALGFGPAAWASLPGVQEQSADLQAAFTAMDDGKGALAPVLRYSPLLPIIGLIVLAVALWRHTTTPRLALVAMPVGWAVFLFGPVNLVKSAGAIVLLGAFTSMRSMRVRRP